MPAHPFLIASGVGVIVAGITDAAQPSSGGFLALLIGSGTAVAVAGIGAYALIKQRRNPEEMSAIAIASSADANVTTLRHDLVAETADRKKNDDELWKAVREIEEHVRPWPDRHRDSRPTRSRGD